MAYLKVQETPETLTRYFNKKTKRLMISSVCSICGDRRDIRWDHYKNRYLDNKKELRCRDCASIKFIGYEHQTGYIIRHWKSYERKYWSILKQMCKKNGQIKEHRANLAINIGRPLKSCETVHHKNGNRKDNRIDNLELMMGQHGQGFRLKDVLEQNKKLIKENELLRKEVDYYSNKTS